MTRLLLTLVLAACASCRIVPPETTPPPVCTDQHSWNNYHLPHHALEPVIRNHSSFQIDLDAWNTLDTPLKLRTVGVGFEILMRDGGDASSGWLGRATVGVGDEGHIRDPLVEMNAIKLASYSDIASAHVACQELGHALGLDHQRMVTDSCMDDCQGRGSREAWLACLNNPNAIGPNAHDAEQLRKIYAHVLDGTAPRPEPPDCAGATVLHTFEEVTDS